MNIDIAKFSMANDDHCWIENTDNSEYVENCVCDNCAANMEEISNVVNKEGEKGIALGLCPDCGYIKHTRNLSQEWYDRHFEKNWLKKRNDELVENRYVFELLSPFLPESGRVLDVGAGNGHRLISFQSAGYEAIGVEPSIKRSTKASQQLDTIINQPGEKYFSESNKEFDVIFFFNVLQFTENPFKLISMASERLKAGGLLFVRFGEFYHNNNFFIMTHNGVMRSFLSIYALKELIQKLGLSPIYISENPMEIVFKKGECENSLIDKFNNAKKITKEDVNAFAYKTLNGYKLKIFKKSGILFNNRKVILSVKQPTRELIPVSFVHNSSQLPIILK